MRIGVLNGPNLNLLGIREPDVYGRETLEDLRRAVERRAAEEGVDLDWIQTNAEGAFIDAVHGLRDRADGALVNAGAWTHTSLAIRDALVAVGVPFVEVHLSNIFAREERRRVSVLADAAVGIVAGFGHASYLAALDGLLAHLRRRDT